MEGKRKTLSSVSERLEAGDFRKKPRATGKAQNRADTGESGGKKKKRNKKGVEIRFKKRRHKKKKGGGR